MARGDAAIILLHGGKDGGSVRGSGAPEAERKRAPYRHRPLLRDQQPTEVGALALAGGQLLAHGGEAVGSFIAGARFVGAGDYNNQQIGAVGGIRRPYSGGRARQRSSCPGRHRGWARSIRKTETAVTVEDPQGCLGAGECDPQLDEKTAVATAGLDAAAMAIR